jgi:hypothetical protein
MKAIINDPFAKKETAKMVKQSLKQRQPNQIKNQNQKQTNWDEEFDQLSDIMAENDG